MAKKRLTIITISLVLLIGSFLLGALYLFANQGTIPKGTVVAGLELGGYKTDKAYSLVDQKIANLEQKNVTMTVDGRELTVTWSRAGISFDAAAFREAVRQLSRGSLWERVRARFNFSKVWGLEVALDPKALGSLFTPDWEKEQFGVPVDAVRMITPDDMVRYIPEQSVLRIDRERLSRQLTTAASDWVRRQVLGGSRQNLLAPNTSESIRLDVPLRSIQPKVTVESLQREGIRRKIVQFTTGLSTSGPGRRYNVDAAARSIDGIVLAPGEIFDYAKVIEYAEKTYGFREAPVILRGKLVPGIGGGICQVSSTLYNAAIRTGLEIIERRNHSLPVSYLPKGQDATFAKGYINFRFKNTFGHHLLIRAEVENDQLIVKLFGDMPKNISYTIESRTTKVLPPPEKYVTNSSLPFGSKQIILKGTTGYIVETYRIKKIDDQAVGSILLSRDTYPPQPSVIAVPSAESGAGGGSNPDFDPGAGSGTGGADSGSGSGSGSGSNRPGSPDSDPPKPSPYVEDGVSGPNFR